MAWMADWFQATIDLASGDYELGDLYGEEQKELVSIEHNILSINPSRRFRQAILIAIATVVTRI